MPAQTAVEVEHKRWSKCNTLFLEENKKGWRKLFGQEKYFLWRRSKRRKIFGKGKYFYAEEKNNREGKGGKYHGKERIVADGWLDKNQIRGPRGPKNNFFQVLQAPK